MSLSLSEFIHYELVLRDIGTGGVLLDALLIYHQWKEDSYNDHNPPPS